MASLLLLCYVFYFRLMCERQGIKKGFLELQRASRAYVKVSDPGCHLSPVFKNYLSALQSSLKKKKLPSCIHYWSYECKNRYLVPMYLCIWPFEFLKYHDKLKPRHFFMFYNLWHILHTFLDILELWIDFFYEWKLFWKCGFKFIEKKIKFSVNYLEKNYLKIQTSRGSI